MALLRRVERQRWLRLWPRTETTVRGHNHVQRGSGAVGEVLQQVRVARHDDLVVGVDTRRRVRVLEALLGAADRQHVDAVTAAQVEFFEGRSLAPPAGGATS